MPRLSTPAICIDDYCGTLPMNLQRSKLMGAASPVFVSKVAEDVARDLVAFALVAAPECPPWNTGAAIDPQSPWAHLYPLHLGSSTLTPKFEGGGELAGAEFLHGQWIASHSGVMPFQPYLIDALDVSQLVFLVAATPRIGNVTIGRDRALSLPPCEWPKHAALAFGFDTYFPRPGQDLGPAWDRRMLYELLWHSVNGEFPDGFSIKGANVVAIDGVCDLEQTIRSCGFTSQHVAVEKTQDRVIARVGGPVQLDLKLVEEILQASYPNDARVLPYIAVLDIDGHVGAEPSDAIGRCWVANIGRQCVPFDPMERTEIIKNAMNRDARLAEHIKHWERFAVQWRQDAIVELQHDPFVRGQ